MGEAFVQGVTTMLNGVTAWFTTVFNSLGGIFMTGEGDKATLSVIGWILAIVVAISVVGFGIRFIMSLVRRIRA